MIELYDYQKKHADTLTTALRHKKVAKDASDTGTGKTPVACVIAERFKFKKIVVVCPKAVIPVWFKWFRETRYDIDGERPVVQVVNYESLRTGKHACLIRKGKRFRWNLPHQSLVIFDEDHRLKGRMTLNSRMLYAAKQAKLHIMLLGATSFTSPLEMDSMGYALNLHRGYRGFTEWLVQNCGCYKDHFHAWKFPHHSSVLLKIHQYIFPDYGSRMSTKDIVDFPENNIMVEGYSAEDIPQLDGYFETIREHYEELTDYDPDNDDNPLTQLLRARQRIELEKIPSMVDLARADFHGNRHVALFVNFRNTLTELVHKLGKIDPHISVVHGGQTVEERQKNIEDFQSDTNPLIVCTIASGGVGISLHDLHGNHPRSSLISPSFSAIELRQALGRIHRAGSKSKSTQRIVLVAGSVEEVVGQKLQHKLDALDTINDSDLNPFTK